MTQLYAFIVLTRYYVSWNGHERSDQPGHSSWGLMRRLATPRSALTLAAVLLIGSAVSATAHGQTFGEDRNPGTGIGYQGLFPQAKVGVDVWHFLGDTPYGVFANAKTTFPTWRGKRNYCPPTIEQCDTDNVVDTGGAILYLRDRIDWTLLNGGAMFAIGPDFAVRLGVGAARRRISAEFVDESHELHAGPFLVPYTEDVWRLQYVGNLLLRVSPSMAVSLGYETAPRGLAIGASYVFP